MGLNLTFVEDANWEKIAQCLEAKNTPQKYTLWQVRREWVPLRVSRPRKESAEVIEFEVARRQRRKTAIEIEVDPPPRVETEEVDPSDLGDIDPKNIRCCDLILPDWLAPYVDKSEEEYLGRPDEKGRISVANDFVLADMPDNVRLQMEAEYPITGDDDEVDDFYKPHISVSTEWDAQRGYEKCQGCPLAPNDNFTGCYPRMGSYTYVASLCAWVQEEASREERLHPLLNNAFVKATEPGGYRIDTERWSEGVRRAFYEEHLAAIRQCREVIEQLETEAGLLYGEDGEKVEAFGAEPARSRFGYNWISGCTEGCWGIHSGKGIGWITGGGVDRTPEKVVYFREIVRREEKTVAISFDGAEQEIPDCGLLRTFGKDFEWYTRIVWGKDRAIERFSWLLDTAEKALELALEHNLELQEC